MNACGQWQTDSRHWNNVVVARHKTMAHKHECGAPLRCRGTAWPCIIIHNSNLKCFDTLSFRLIIRPVRETIKWVLYAECAFGGVASGARHSVPSSSYNTTSCELFSGCPFCGSVRAPCTGGQARTDFANQSNTPTKEHIAGHWSNL